MTLIETPLITRLHAVHEKRGIVDLACLLCREAKAKANRPVWVGHPRSFDPRPAA